jgi:hypothetical protein
MSKIRLPRKLKKLVKKNPDKDVPNLNLSYKIEV